MAIIRLKNSHITLPLRSLAERHNMRIEFLGSNSLRNFFNRCFLRNILLLITGLIWPFLEAASQNYFQQKVNYDIHVALNDLKHELNGYETVEYINNSPDTLYFIYFHLWPNAYSDNKTALAKEILNREGKSKLFSDPELRGYIDSLNFKDRKYKSIKWMLLDDSPDICKLIPRQTTEARAIQFSLTRLFM